MTPKSAKRGDCMTCVCNGCMKKGGIVLLVLGVLFLLADLGYWKFWNIQWWTVVFLLAGLVHIGAGKCPDCVALKKKR